MNVVDDDDDVKTYEIGREEEAIVDLMKNIFCVLDLVIEGAGFSEWNESDIIINSHHFSIMSVEL